MKLCSYILSFLCLCHHETAKYCTTIFKYEKAMRLQTWQPYSFDMGKIFTNGKETRTHKL